MDQRWFVIVPFKSRSREVKHLSADVSQRRRRVLFAILFTIVLSACAPQIDSIRVAYAPFESTALFWIAYDQNFFGMNGLNVTARQYATGVGALDGMVNGEADIAVGPSEYPLVGRALSKAKIRTVASIAKSEFIYVVARKDRGITKASDLMGKKVGTTFRTIAHFYIGRFLELNGVNPHDSTLVELKTPEEWVNAVVNGDVDAVATAQPYANVARDRLGANAVVWSAQSLQSQQTQVIASDEWIVKQPELIVRFLRALLQAENFAINRPDEAKAIVQNRLNLDPTYMETVWSQNDFTLSLDQSLVLALEDEARWMIKNNLTDEKATPNFLDYIYENALKQVKPNAVNVIR